MCLTGGNRIMGTTSGFVCLVIGIFSLIASIWRPGSLILAIIALYAAYANLKGNGKMVSNLPPPIHTTDEETTVCANCGTENLAIAKSCRGCAKTLVKTDTTNENQ